MFLQGCGSSDIELSLQLLQAVLSAATQEPESSPDWVMDCSPFPLLYVLAQLLNQSLRWVIVFIHFDYNEKKSLPPAINKTKNIFFIICQVLGAATRGRCLQVVHRLQGTAGVCAKHPGGASGRSCGSVAQQLVQSSVLAPQPGGGAGLDGSPLPQARLGGAL